MPTPVSHTATCTIVSDFVAAMPTLPLSGCKLHGIGEEIKEDLFHLALIASQGVNVVGNIQRQRDAVRQGTLLTITRLPSKSCLRSNVPSSSSSIPASTLDKSKISLIRLSRYLPLLRTSSRYSSCLAFTSPNILSSSTSENPMMALRGVRSSWDMLARNSDLWRLAISNWTLTSWSCAC